MKTRLAILAVVRAHLHNNCPETEPNKALFSCAARGPTPHPLPPRLYLGSAQAKPTQRYFVDKFPMFVHPPRSSSSPVATFSYVHAGTSTLLDFTHHLEAYLPLFRQLSEFGFIYASRPEPYFERATEAFRSSLK